MRRAGSEDDVGEDDGEAAVAVVSRLTPAERRRAWVLGVTPPLLAIVVMLALARSGRATLGDVVVGVVLYGGLLGVTLAVVAHERMQAAHCPRCDATGRARREVCGACGYDLAERPMYRCDQRHPRHVEPGLCGCGRRLQRMEPLRGMDRELKRTLWAGAWLAAFLLGVALLLPLVD